MVKDTHQKTGAIFKSEEADSKSQARQALDKMKKLERQRIAKMKTFKVGTATIRTTKSREEWEQYEKSSF